MFEGGTLQRKAKPMSIRYCTTKGERAIIATTLIGNDEYVVATEWSPAGDPETIATNICRLEITSSDVANGETHDPIPLADWLRDNGARIIAP